MMKKPNKIARAVIIGISGQDGAYLARRLIKDGLVVYGTSRKVDIDTARLRALGVADRVDLRVLDPLNSSDLRNLLHELRPDEIYNLSGQSSVGHSFHDPETTFASIATAQLRLLEAVRQLKIPSRIFFAGSGDCFGSIATGTQSCVGDSFNPQSPYAAAKVAAAEMTKFYRCEHGISACTGFLYNHESPLRRHGFVTHKIIDTAVAIAKGRREKLSLGNIEVYRDWGFAGEYVDAMVAMLRQDSVNDYVIASGEPYRLSSFVEQAFLELGLDWREHTKVEASLKRSSDLDYCCGDPDQAVQELGWRARVKFAELIRLLVNARLDADRIDA